MYTHVVPQKNGILRLAWAGQKLIQILASLLPCYMQFGPVVVRLQDSTSKTANSNLLIAIISSSRLGAGSHVKTLAQVPKP